MTEHDETASKAPGRAKHVVRHSLRVSWWILILPVVFALVLAVSLIDRDITAPTWIKTRIENSATQLLGGGTLKFAKITVNVGRDLHPRVRLSDAVLTDADGATLAQINEVSGLISPRGVFLQRDTLMQEVNITGAQVALRRDAGGAIAVSFDSSGRDVKTAASFPDLLEQIDNVFAQPSLEALEQVQLSGLVVNYTDIRAGRHWTLDGGTIDLDLSKDETALRGAFSLLSGGTKVTNFTVSYDSPRGARRADIGLEIENALARDLATQSAALNWLAAIDAPLSGSLRTSLDDTGALGPMNATLTLDAGALQPNATATPLKFTQVKTYIAYDPESDRVLFNEVNLKTEWGHFQASGQALLRDVVDGLPQVLLGQFNFSDISLSPANLYQVPIALSGATLDFRLRLDPFEIEIGQAAVADPLLPAIVSGHVRATPQGWQSALDLKLAGASSDSIMSLWPESLLPVVHRWFVAYLKSADLSNINIGWRAGPDQATHMAGGFAFSETEVRFLKDMPPIQAASGIASFDASSFALTIEEGHVVAPQGGRVTMAGSSMRIPDFKPKPSLMQIDLVLDSTITAVTSLIEQPPLRLMTRAKLPVVLADGVARTTGYLEFPITRKLKPPQVIFDFAAQLNNVRSNVLIPRHQLTASALDLEVRNGRLDVSGRARLDGIPLNGDFRRNLDAAGDAELTAQVRLSSDFLDAFGVNLPNGAVSGAGQGTLRVALAKDTSPRYDLRSDLRGIGLAIPQIGWRKRQSVAGELIVAGTLGSQPSVERLVVSGDGLSATGRVNFGANGALDAARFDRVRLGNWLNAPITVRGRGQGRPVAIDIAGGTLDLRRAKFGAGGGGQSGPMNLRLDRLQITEGIALTDFRGEFGAGRGFSGQFTGLINGAAAIQGTVVPQNGRSAVRITSDDAGSVARATGLLRDANGGTLDLTLQPATAAGTFDGILAIKRLRVRNASAMAQLLDAISVVGLLQQLDGQGLAFDEVDARFQLTPTQVILAEASAVGPGLGISLDGLYTLADKSLDLQGVVSPFYLINSIGSILTRRGEGLIGFSFNVRGTSNDPSVSVNPLSVLTPGMFREIFRRAPPEISQ